MKRSRSESNTKHLDLVTFGEAMLTYKPVPPSTCNDTPLTTGASLVVQAVGGAELNTAVAASLVGKKAAWASVLPAGPLGKVVVDAAAAAGLELAAPYVITADGATIGTVHVVDDGAGSRPHYQRSHSAFCRLIDGSTFGWDALLLPAKWLHITGITPPLGIGPLAAWRAAVRAAGPVGALVSLDLNWRPALGPFDELWALVLPELRHVTLLILSEADLVRLGCTEPQHVHACVPWLAAARAVAHRSRGLSAQGPPFAPEERPWRRSLPPRARQPGSTLGSTPPLTIGHSPLRSNSTPRSRTAPPRRPPCSGPTRSAACSLRCARGGACPCSHAPSSDLSTAARHR